MFLSAAVSSLQDVIMAQLDHKNLDKDVPYFADVVRWAGIPRGGGARLLPLSLSVSRPSAHRRTWPFSSGTTWWRFCRPTCSTRLSFTRRIRILSCIEESKRPTADKYLFWPLPLNAVIHLDCLPSDDCSDLDGHGSGLQRNTPLKGHQRHDDS